MTTTYTFKIAYLKNPHRAWANGSTGTLTIQVDGPATAFGLGRASMKALLQAEVVQARECGYDPQTEEVTAELEDLTIEGVLYKLDPDSNYPYISTFSAPTDLGGN